MVVIQRCAMVHHRRGSWQDAECKLPDATCRHARCKMQDARCLTRSRACAVAARVVLDTVAQCCALESASPIEAGRLDRLYGSIVRQGETRQDLWIPRETTRSPITRAAGPPSSGTARAAALTPMLDQAKSSTDLTEGPRMPGRTTLFLAVLAAAGGIPYLVVNGPPGKTHRRHKRCVADAPPSAAPIDPTSDRPDTVADRAARRRAPVAYADTARTARAADRVPATEWPARIVGGRRAAFRRHAGLARAKLGLASRPVCRNPNGRGCGCRGHAARGRKTWRGR